jgi:small subunit ribosomal protein S16
LFRSFEIQKNLCIFAPSNSFINVGFVPQTVKIMATRIRLQRHGKKGKPFFHLVAADSRAKRDGKFIEKLGTYNPTANPAVIDINFEATLTWVQTGAEMSDTARAILSYKGVLYKNHLLNGVKKGALTLEQVEEKFAQWLANKDSKVQNKVEGLAKNAASEKVARQQAEEAAKLAKAAQVAAKNAPAVEEVEEVAEEVAEETTEAVAEEVAEETTEAVAEEVVEETKEAVAEEVIEEEAPVAEEAPATEEVVAEEAPVVEEAPAAEEASEEAAAE